MTAPADTAGVIVRPPILMLGTLAAAVALHWLLPWPLPAPLAAARWPLGAAAALGGFALAGWAIRCFRSAGTPVPTWKPTAALVTSGPYARTRNPIYLGLAGLHLGLGLLAGTLWGLPALAAALVVLRYGVIAREEAYLDRRFGAAWHAYRARVRRWF